MFKALLCRDFKLCARPFRLMIFVIVAAGAQFVEQLHELTLFLLAHRRQCLAERPMMAGHELADEVSALLRQLSQDHAPIIWVADALHEAVCNEPVDEPGDVRPRDDEVVADLRERHGLIGLAVEHHENVETPGREIVKLAEGRERIFEIRRGPLQRQDDIERFEIAGAAAVDIALDALAQQFHVGPRIFGGSSGRRWHSSLAPNGLPPNYLVSGGFPCQRMCSKFINLRWKCGGLGRLSRVDM